MSVSLKCPAGVAVWSPSPKGWPEGPRAEHRDASRALQGHAHAASLCTSAGNR